LYKNREQLLKENKELKNEISEIKKTIESLKEGKFNNQNELDIPINKPIKVMSLYYGILTLKTANRGGKHFRFDNFGDIMPIIYNDLALCISSQRRFFRDGFCIILDESVIKTHGLEKDYKKILNKETIDNFLEFDKNKISELFNNTTLQLQRTIVDSISQKLINKEIVDMNKIDLISKLYGQDIKKMMENL
jgi:hypothetical protein